MNKRVSILRRSDARAEKSILNDDSEIDWMSSTRRDTDWWKHLGNESGSRFFPPNTKHTKIDNTVVMEESYISLKLQEVYEFSDDENFSIESLSDISRTSSKFVKPKGLFKSNAKKPIVTDMPALPSSSKDISLRNQKNNDIMYDESDYLSDVSFNKSSSLNNNSSLGFGKPKGLFKSNASTKRVNFDELLQTSKDANSSDYLEDFDPSAVKKKKSLFKSNTKNDSKVFDGAVSNTEFNTSQKYLEDVENSQNLSNISNRKISKIAAEKNLNSPHIVNVNMSSYSHATSKINPEYKNEMNSFNTVDNMTINSNITLPNRTLMEAIGKQKKTLFKSSRAQRKSNLFAGAISEAESTVAFISDEEMDMEPSKIDSAKDIHASFSNNHLIEDQLKSLDKEVVENIDTVNLPEIKTQYFEKRLSRNSNRLSKINPDYKNEINVSNTVDNTTLHSNITLPNKTLMERSGNQKKTLFKSSRAQRKSKLFAGAISETESTVSFGSDEEMDIEPSKNDSAKDVHASFSNNHFIEDQSKSLDKEMVQNIDAINLSENKTQYFEKRLSANSHRLSRNNPEYKNEINGSHTVNNTTLTSNFTLPNKTLMDSSGYQKKTLFKSSKAQRKSKLFAGAISETESTGSFSSDEEMDMEKSKNNSAKDDHASFSNNHFIEDQSKSLDKEVVQNIETINLPENKTQYFEKRLSGNKSITASHINKSATQKLNSTNIDETDMLGAEIDYSVPVQLPASNSPHEAFKHNQSKSQKFSEETENSQNLSNTSNSRISKKPAAKKLNSPNNLDNNKNSYSQQLSEINPEYKNEINNLTTLDNTTVNSNITLPNKTLLESSGKQKKTLFKSSKTQRKSKLFAGAISESESTVSFNSDEEMDMERSKNNSAKDVHGSFTNNHNIEEQILPHEIVDDGNLPTYRSKSLDKEGVQNADTINLPDIQTQIVENRLSNNSRRLSKFNLEYKNEINGSNTVDNNTIIGNSTLPNKSLMESIGKQKKTLFKSSKTQRKSKLFAGAISESESIVSFNSDEEMDMEPSKNNSAKDVHGSFTNNNFIEEQILPHEIVDDGDLPTNRLKSTDKEVIQNVEPINLLENKTQYFEKRLSVHKNIAASHLNNSATQKSSTSNVEEINMLGVEIDHSVPVSKSPHVVLNYHQRKSQKFLGDVDSSQNPSNISNSEISNKPADIKLNSPKNLDANKSSYSHQLSEINPGYKNEINNITTVVDTTVNSNITLPNKTLMESSGNQKKTLFKSAKAQRKSKSFAGAISETESTVSFSSDEEMDMEESKNNSAKDVHASFSNNHFIEDQSKSLDKELVQNIDTLNLPENKTQYFEKRLSGNKSITASHINKSATQQLNLGNVDESNILGPEIDYPVPVQLPALNSSHEAFKHNQSKSQKFLEETENSQNLSNTSNSRISKKAAPKNFNLPNNLDAKNSSYSHQLPETNPVYNNEINNLTTVVDTTINSNVGLSNKTVLECSGNQKKTLFKSSQAQRNSKLFSGAISEAELTISFNSDEEMDTEPSKNNSAKDVHGSFTNNHNIEDQLLTHDPIVDDGDLPTNRSKSIYKEVVQNVDNINLPENKTQHFEKRLSGNSVTASHINKSATQQLEEIHSEKSTVINQDAEKSHIGIKSSSFALFDITNKNSSHQSTNNSLPVQSFQNNASQENSKSYVMFNVSKIIETSAPGNSTQFSGDETSSHFQSDISNKILNSVNFDKATKMTNNVEENTTYIDGSVANSAVETIHEHTEQMTDSEDEIALNISDDDMDTSCDPQPSNIERTTTESTSRNRQPLPIYSTFKSIKTKNINVDAKTKEKMITNAIEKVTKEIQNIRKEAELEVAKMLDMSLPLPLPVLMIDPKSILMNYNKTSDQIIETKHSKKLITQMGKALVNKSYKMNKSKRGDKNRKVSIGRVAKRNEHKKIKLYMKELWITKRLYNFVQNKLKQKYGIMYGKKSEIFMKYLSSVVNKVEKSEGSDVHNRIEELKVHMANMHIITTHRDFMTFVDAYLPHTFRIKSIPAPGRDVPKIKGKLDDPIIKRRKNKH